MSPPASAPGRPRLALAAGTVLGLVGVLLARRTTHVGQLLRHGDEVLVLIGAWAVVGALAAACLLRAPRRTALGVVLVLGLVTRVVATSHIAPLSDDLYRYAWDGRVQAAGIDPYRYPPDALELLRLRDPGWLWPDLQHCQHPLPTNPCPLLNRPAVHTIYPPGAELWFLGLHATGITRGEDLGLEGSGLGLDLAVLAALLALLRRVGRDPLLVGVWALSPLPVLEAVSDAHIDSLAVLLSLGSVGLALSRSRSRPLSTAAVLAGAVLVKLYPLLLFPALVRSRRVAAGALVIALVALAYLPHVLAVGTQVVGYLPGYLREEHYATGTRYLLLDLVGLSGAAATVVVALVLGAVVATVLVRRPDPVDGALALYAALLLLTTPVQPWYALGLGALGVLAGRPEWLAVGLAAYPPYLAAVLDRDVAQWGKVSYAVAAVVLGGVTLARARAPRRTPPPPARTSPPARSPAPGPPVPSPP